MNLPTEYQNFIALSRYSRYRYDLGRREIWSETIDRWARFWSEELTNRLPESVVMPAIEETRQAILSLNTMPAMRTVMTAGPALARDHVAGYNCAYTHVAGSGESIRVWDSRMADFGIDGPLTVQMREPIAFDEIMYILLCGGGVGFSVERQFINTLPTIGNALNRGIYRPSAFPNVPSSEIATLYDNVIDVPDSKYGWASALRLLIVELYNGNFDVRWSLDRIRPKGSPLRTFGGRASGPEPLNQVMQFTKDTFAAARGRKLNSIECNDLVCKIAECVVVGGVRRSATLGLSNLSDDRMRHAKSGDWWVTAPHRRLANLSVCYTETPDIGVFMREWQSLYESKSGERGIFNRRAAQQLCERIGRDPHHEFGCNPCSEIILRPQQFCNLTSVMVRHDQNLETLKRHIRIAAMIGTWQATLTDFAYLSPGWKRNCEEERLLGVSLTGLRDHPVLAHISDESAAWLRELRDTARQVNNEWADKLGIARAAAITCVKPEGTVSQLTDTASGLHARYAPYYIRRVRADDQDPLAQTMREQGFPCESDAMSPDKFVFSFPIKAPHAPMFGREISAINQLEYWLMVQRNYCDHKPSVTVTVKEHEWLDAGAWVYRHFDEMSGVSFLPHSDHVYQQAPYEEITESQYHALAAKIPEAIDMDLLAEREQSDMTIGTQEMACAGGQCELV